MGVADSWFRSIKSVLALSKIGVYLIMLVDTALKNFSITNLYEKHIY